MKYLDLELEEIINGEKEHSHNLGKIFLVKIGLGDNL
jgi:hypothetical protein